METLLVFALFFGVFAWGIWRLLKYTRDTVGDNSPLKVSRVYRVSKWRYFLGFEGIMGGLSILLGIMFFRVLVRTPPNTDLIHPVFLYVLLFFVLTGIAGIGVLALALLSNHWPYARGFSITTNPVDHALKIRSRDREFILQEGDIVSVELVGHKARMGFAYQIFLLTNGDRFLVPQKAPGWNVIHEFFPKIPFSVRYSYYGFIKKGLLP